MAKIPGSLRQESLSQDTDWGALTHPLQWPQDPEPRAHHQGSGEGERDVSEEEPGSNSWARVRLLDVPVEKCCVLMLVAGKQLGWG